INAVYVPFRVPAEHLDQFLSNARQWGIRGLSVTIPHKETVLKRLTKFEPAVKDIGAANTLVFEANDVVGYNTDYHAAIEAVVAGVHAAQKKAEEQPAGEGGLKDKKALILGAGGAARAMIYGLKKHGANAVVCSRTLKRGQQMAHAMGCDCID